MAARLALCRARPGAAQGLRGGAARRDGGSAARRACATRWRPPCAASTAAARCSILGSFVPPAVVGYTLERPIERRLGTPPTIAAGLLLGSAAMAAADRFGPTGRRREEAGFADALALGLAQACALMPGVSRNGMTLAAARAARLRSRRRQRALAPRRAADHRRGHRAEGHAPGAARRSAGAGDAHSRPAWAPPSPRRWPRCGSSARSSATARSRRTRPTARCSRGWCSGALGRIARDERVLCRRRRRHRPGRSRRRRPRRRPAHDRARSAQRLGPAQRSLRVGAARGAQPRDRGLDRRRGLEDRRRRAGRSPRDGGHRLRRHERQRPGLRRCGADRDARLPGRRAGRSRGAGAHRASGSRSARRRRASRSPAASWPCCPSSSAAIPRRTASTCAAPPGHRRAGRDRHRRRGAAGRRDRRPALERPALQRLHARAPRAAGGGRARTRRPPGAAGGPLGGRRAAGADGHLRARGARPAALGHPRQRLGPHHRRRAAQPAAPGRRAAGLRHRGAAAGPAHLHPGGRAGRRPDERDVGRLQHGLRLRRARARGAGR